MRIALLAWEALHALPVGAAAVYAFRLSAALAARGHAVHLFTRMGPGQRFSDVIEGVRYHRVPYNRLPSFYDEILALAAPFTHYVREETEHSGPFDLLLAVDWLTLPAAFNILDTAAAAPRNAPPAFAVTFHTTEWGRAGAWPERGTAAAIAGIERDGIARADAVIAVADRVRRELEALYHPPDWKTDTIRHGLDTAPFHVEPFDPGAAKRTVHLPPDRPFLLYAGRLDRRRGPGLALAAFAECVRTGAPAVEGLRLALVGDGPERVELVREADRLGMAGRVVFPGERVGAELAGLYRASALALAPADVYASGALSAWAAGRPVLAGQWSGSAEVTLEAVNGWIRPNDPHAWGECLADALFDADRLRWMGINGQAALSAAFRWDTVAERTLELCGRKRRLDARIS